jgi:hypothetical protein
VTKVHVIGNFVTTLDGVVSLDSCRHVGGGATLVLLLGGILIPLAALLEGGILCPLLEVGVLHPLLLVGILASLACLLLTGILTASLEIGILAQTRVVGAACELRGILPNRRVLLLPLAGIALLKLVVACHFAPFFRGSALLEPPTLSGPR